MMIINLVKYVTWNISFVNVVKEMYEYLDPLLEYVLYYERGVALTKDN